MNELDSTLLREDPTRRGPIPLVTLQQAAMLIDGRPLELIASWDALDNPREKGGRPNLVSMRAVLIVWLATALEEQRLHLTSVATTFGERLTPTTAEFLGLPAGKHASVDEWYERARRATGRLLRLIDAFPLENRHRRLTKSEWDQEKRRREENQATLDEKYRRADELMNTIVARTYGLLPKYARTKSVSLSIDATAIPIYAKGISVSKLRNFSADRRVSIEPDAGFWARDTVDHADDGKQKVSKSKYAYELEISVLTSNDATQPDAVPHIVLGVGYHAPGFGPGRAARNLFEQVIANGFALDHVIADRAYFPGAKPEVLQNYLRTQGAKIVMDYKSDDFPKMENFKGAIQVDGNWYTPSMPKTLINATLTKLNDLAGIRAQKTLTSAERRQKEQEVIEIWNKQIKARAPYLMRRKQSTDGRGSTPYMCPASGPNPTLDCALKRFLQITSTRPLLRVENVPEFPDDVCTNKSSITIPADAGGKFAQHYQYGTKVWHEQYAHGRNCVESFNDYMKNPSQQSLGEARRRRLRGRTAQYFLSTLVVIASNLAKIRDFINHRALTGDDTENSKPAPEARSRRSSRRSTTTQRRNARANGAGSKRTGAKPRARTLT
jgi:hypothetical protein